MKRIHLPLYILAFLSGCSDSSQLTEWYYRVEFPSEFIPISSDIPQRFWESKNGAVKIGEFYIAAERSEFASLTEFGTHLNERNPPRFFRVSNGRDIAVDVIEGRTRIAIAHPENTDYWQIFTYGISGATSSDESIQETRGRAIGAILSGRFLRDLNGHNKPE